MIIFFFITAIGIVASELLLRLPFYTAFEDYKNTLQKAFRVIKSLKISDRWKERALLHYAVILLKNTMTLLKIY